MGVLQQRVRLGTDYPEGLAAVKRLSLFCRIQRTGWANQFRGARFA